MKNPLFFGHARPIVALLALLGLLAGAAAPAATVKAKTAMELDAIQGRIRSLEKEITRAAGARPTAGKALRDAELVEADARKELQDIRRELAAGRERERQLRADIGRAQADVDRHRAMLEQQLRLAYVTGREEWLRLTLSQQDPVALSRRLVHYGYITRQRGTLLAGLQAEILALETAAAELAAQLTTLADLGKRQEARLGEVTAARKVRARALQTIERDLGTRQQKLGGLRREARALQQLMTRLEREAKANARRAPQQKPPAPAGPALQVKDLPLRGRAVARFGQPRADGLLRWEGTVLAAPAGSEVRAVRAGRVVYADWLPGMGQLMVLDHGRGYMSLYGHNQQLLKAAGHDVRQGEVIARVGDSGGQGAPGLYFEVRRNGKPINPREWMR